MTANPDAAACTVFLSYARADRARAARLVRALEAAGLRVWWDGLIEGGAAFASTIATQLEAADVVLVLWSRASIESDWVRDEAARGRDRHRLVPVSLDGSAAPLGFRQYQVIDLARWRGRADAPEIAAVTRAVAAACGEALPARPAAPAVSRRGALAVGAGAAACAVGAAGYLGWREGLFGASIAGNSLAILPFKDLGGSAAAGWFAAGLTEEFRAALSRNPALAIIAGASSEAASAAGGDVKAVARKLGVAFVLDGAIRRAGDTVRISANLSDGATGVDRWSQSFDRRLADVFALQSEVAGLVARELAVRIATTAPAPGGTAVVAAYEAYLRGRALFNAARDEATDRAALGQYDLALAADPRFALAHAARARSLAAIAAEYAKADALRPLYDAAIAAAGRAVELAPDLPEARLALGYATFTGRLDVPGARGPYDEARRLGGGDADILLLFALYAVRAGRGPEALTAIRRALALDPLNPRTYRAAGSIHYALRRYRPAIGYLRRALALNPAISNAHALVGSCLYQLGRTGEARAAFTAEPHAIFRLTGLAIADHRLGDAAAAKQALAELVATEGDAVLYQRAEVLAQWGDAAGALAALGRARTMGDSGLLYLTTDPMLDPVARAPAFLALVRDLHLA